MRKLGQWMLFLAMVAAYAPLHAATATDFYVGLLRRGVAEVEAGHDAEAVTPLRLAAFGLLDSIEHYQTAQAHLVVALDRLNQTEPAREAALRIVAAERIEHKFASLGISPAIRTAFATSARKLLPASDAALLLNAPPATTTTSAPPQTSAKAEPPKKPAVESAKPVVEPSKPVVEPSKPVVEKPAAATTTPSKTPPKVTPPAPKPAPAQKTTIDVPARLAAGERALVAANLAEARKIYRELLDAPNLDHASAIRVAEGLYRSRDFAGALAAFQRAGDLRAGEEAYRYYVAVAAYETGQFDRAKRELAAALPFIEITPDVERYRARIQAAR